MEVQRKTTPPGRAVQVVTLSEEERCDVARQLKLDTQVLRSILAETEGHPIAVLAIAGPARGGKSFVLSYIVRYLQSLENSSDGTCNDWLDKGQPGVSIKDKGFEFSNNLERTTEGIWMWSRPFIIKSGPCPCAVLLMDTEGCFDPYSSDKEQSCIIGLSLLLSSCFIFNDSVRINENTLMTLAKFAQFGKIASQAFDGKAFQRLMFLVRDWNNPNVFDFGAAGGQGFIHKTMEPRPRMSAEALQSRVNISENFEHFNAYLMPHPGTKVLASDYNGCIEHMSPDFLFHLENFVANIVADIVPKKIATELAVRSSFYDVFCRFVDAFNQDDIPNPDSIVEATIYAALDSQLRIFAESYVQELTEKLLQSKAPFHAEDRLQKYHQRIRKSILGRFSVKRHPGNEDQKQIFANKLSEKLESIINDFIAENAKKQQDFVDSCENRVMQKFLLLIEDTCTSADKIWFEPEFVAAISGKEEEFVEEFFQAVKEAPENIIRASMERLQQKIIQAKDHTWKTLEEKTQIAETLVGEIIVGLESIYENLMNVLICDDEALSENKIIKTHEKQFLKAEKSFFTEIKQKFSDEEFIDRSHALLRSTFQRKLDKYLDENQIKLQKLIAVLEKDIMEGVKDFNEQIAPLTANMSSPNFEENVNQLHSRHLDAALQSLNERDIPDMKIMNSFREKYRSALDSSMDTVLQSKLYRTRKNEATVESLLKELSNSISKVVSSQDVFDPHKLQDQLDLICQESKSICERALLTSNIDCADLLCRFESMVLQEKQNTLEEYTKKIHELEEEIGLKIQKCRQEYCEQMKMQEQQWNDLEEARSVHEEVSKKIITKFQDEALQEFPSLVSEYKKRLEDALSHAFRIFQSSLDTKLKRRQQIQLEIIPNSLNEFCSSLQEFVKLNPFVNGPELILTFQQKSQPLLDKIEGEISEVFSPVSKERTDVLKKFLDDINQAKESVTKYSSEVKTETEASINELIYTSVSFAEELPAFKALLKEVSEPLQDEVRALTKSYFDSEWVFLFDGEKKHKAWNEVEMRVQHKIHACLENLEKKREEDEKSVEIISCAVLSNLCCNIEMELFVGKFYVEDYLEPMLNQGRKEAKAEFLKKLDDKDIPVVSNLEEMTTKIEDKITQIRERNELSRKTAIAEATSVCDEFLENRKTSCKTEDEVQRVGEDAMSKCLEYLRSRYMNETEEPDDSIESEVKQYCEDVHKKFLESFEPEDEELINEVLEQAVKFYKDSMDKFLLGMPAINPKSLFEFHGFSLNATLHKIRTTRRFVSKKLLFALHKRLNEAYTVYQDRNSLRNAEETNTAIGIDLGTTTSCVAIFKHGAATVIPDNSGKNLTPSWVYFDDDGSTMVGNEAKNQAHTFPEKTIFDAKRLIGRKISDRTVQEDMKTWPFPITADRSGKPKISVGGKKYDPEHISALVLAHMKEIAEKHLSEPVTKAVITVPANFNDRQRDATRQAAEIAGLEVLQIINEPTAAAMAHALNWNEDAKTILVFDFGGGTFDVSILRTDFQPPIAKSAGSQEDTTGVTRDAPTSSGVRLKVLATRGHMHLGGEDFDSNMVKFCAMKFEEQHGSPLLESSGIRNEDKRLHYRRLYRMRNACEEAKVILSTNDSATVSLDSITNTEDLDVTISRAEFEAMNEDLFQEAIKIVEEAIDGACIYKDEITDVLMVGGSSRIPRVKKLLQDFLELASLTINQKVDIQETVALGAAVQACILNGGSSVHSLPMVKDIQPFSLGIEVKGGGMSVIIRRGATIPKEATEMYYTVEDDQDTVRITIFAGEDLDVARNNITLGEFFLKGIPPGSAGAQQIAVHMRIDVNGILNVSAMCTSTGGSHGLVIQDTRGRLTDDEILRMRAEMHKS